MRRAIPALPVRDVRAATEHYASRFGFEPVHVTDDFSVVVRGEVELHLWSASDEAWRRREDLAALPVRSGAESFLAGTASCRIAVDDVDGLHAELSDAGVLHPAGRGEVAATDFGTREFPTSDLDGNLLTFFSSVPE